MLTAYAGLQACRLTPVTRASPSRGPSLANGDAATQVPWWISDEHNSKCALYFTHCIAISQHPNHPSNFQAIGVYFLLHFSRSCVSTRTTLHFCTSLRLTALLDTTRFVNQKMPVCLVLCAVRFVIPWQLKAEVRLLPLSLQILRIPLAGV